jgi:hypothetical protein
MEALSQLDVQAPDHVSVITREGKVTILDSPSKLQGLILPPDPRFNRQHQR